MLKECQTLLIPTYKICSLYNILITLPNIMDNESSVCINYERIDPNHSIEETLSHQRLSQIINHACDEDSINLSNIEDFFDFTCIHSTHNKNGLQCYNIYWSLLALQIRSKFRPIIALYTKIPASYSDIFPPSNIIGFLCARSWRAHAR